MFRKLLSLFTLFLLSSQLSIAKIDIVYPTTKEITVNAASMFFLGNTDTGAELYVNAAPVKLWERNFFVHVVPLNYGRNEIKFTEKYNGETNNLIYYVNRPKPKQSTWNQPIYEEKPADTVLFSRTIKDNATIREKPSSSSRRLLDLQKDVVLYIKGQQGEYYKIDEKGETEFWIHKSNISTPEKVHQKIDPIITDRKFFSDEKYNYAKFFLTLPVLYTVKQNGNNIELILYGIKSKDENGNIQDNFKYKFETNRDILGYDCQYGSDYLLFRMAKLPEKFQNENPLKGITIFVDAGHGGIEKGSVGPTRIAEKDINLAITKNLTNMLKEAGANVVNSRTDDIKVPLYERVEKAKQNDALISLSIHANALPNGSNPYLKHGTEVHYYNENAKQLAEIIKNNLVSDLKLKDNGIHKSSFALDRSTNPVSVLVEVAYMIYPEEYIQLKDKNFQMKVAESIKKSLENYLVMLKK